MTQAGQTVVVTGAGGFVGGHLVAELVRRGARVRAFCRYNSRGDRGALAWLEPAVTEALEVTFGDLRDAESVAAAIKDARVVIHLGAQIAIPYSFLNPRDFFETNVLGSLNVAQAALDAGIERLVHVSSSEVYGNAREIPMTEGHPLAPRSPYAASKVGADKLLESFHHTYDLPVTIVRPFNTYGPHQSARAVIPTIISQALGSETVKLGELHTTRDFTYVSDIVNGLIAAASSPATAGRTIHLGSGKETAVAELVRLAAQLLQKELEVQQDPRRVRPAASEVNRLVCDPSLARELLGWEPRIGLSEGLSLTAAWVAANPERFDAEEYRV